MAYFSDAVITNAGNNLLQAYAGGATLTIVGAEGGEGTVSASALLSQTALVSKKQTLSMVRRETVTGGLKLAVRITNGDVDTQYKLQQIGILASVNGGASTLLALFQDDAGVVIPTHTSQPDFSFTFYATIIMSNSGNLSVTIDPSGVVTQADAATEDPAMDGAAEPGNSTKWAREDHVHPTDTSRQQETSSLAAETALDDGDYLPFYDASAAGHRKTLWSNVKSRLKTYFDSLYAAVTGSTLNSALAASPTAVATLGTLQVRNIAASTSDPSASAGNNGDIWIVYES